MASMRHKYKHKINYVILEQSYFKLKIHTAKCLWNAFGPLQERKCMGVFILWRSNTNCALCTTGRKLSFLFLALKLTRGGNENVVMSDKGTKITRTTSSSFRLAVKNPIKKSKGSSYPLFHFKSIQLQFSGSLSLSIQRSLHRALDCVVLEIDKPTLFEEGRGELFSQTLKIAFSAEVPTLLFPIVGSY